MPQKEWIAHHNGHEIRVVNTWTGGTRLYVDGECRDHNGGWYAPDWTWWLSTRLVRDDPKSDLVEVFVRALLHVKAEIRLNGKHLAGEKH
jgi:hypothetical protein